MWFAKWFGGRREADDDEPARVAPTPVRRPVQSASHTAPPARGAQPVANKQAGFDPYNSGAFERRNAWERVSRR